MTTFPSDSSSSFLLPLFPPAPSPHALPTPPQPPPPPYNTLLTQAKNDEARALEILTDDRRRSQPSQPSTEATDSAKVEAGVGCERGEGGGAGGGTETGVDDDEYELVEVP